MQKYIRITDALIVLLAVCAGDLVRFGLKESYVHSGNWNISYGYVSPTIAVLWYLTLRGMQSAGERILGLGPEEYSRIFRATFLVFGFTSILAVLTETDLSRGYLAVAFTSGLFSLLLSRWMWRKWATHGYKLGRYERRVVAVGNFSLIGLLNLIEQNPHLQWKIVGICHTQEGWNPRHLPGIPDETPIINDWRQVRRLTRETGADTVAISAAHSIGMKGMRELTWDLEDADVDIFVAPGILDVAGPRMIVRSFAGMPLIHIDKPRYEGASRTSKMLLDRLGSALLILLFLPLFILCAIAIKLTSRGPVLYISERLGLNNEPFGMIKFRTMVVNADRMKDELRSHNESEGDVLFKMKDDPRITKVGRFLRRFSLDELPQLFNVLGGSMSLVGPRPPLREEVSKYDNLAARRMLVKPGMTGLWQVSGRSGLSWEQSVRLDLTYVENWSILGDIQILWHTVRAVLSQDGAY